VFIQTLSSDPAFYVCWLASLVLSITLHELGHVFAALRQGDDTPRQMGRVTLDPLVHMGWVSLLTAALLGLAWGVTPVNERAFRGRRGRAYVAFGGPAVNLVLALIGLTVLALVARSSDTTALLHRSNLTLFLSVFGSLNLLLFVFNMLPIPPLDGASILADFVRPFDRLRHLPEAQPWFFAALIGAVMLLPLQQVAMKAASLYLSLWL
jgi:Zn-dependent protease